MLEHFCFTLGIADVADALRRLRIDLELAEYFSFSWILPAREFGLAGTMVSGVVVSADTEVFPCSGSLPMGFSWSLYFCRRIMEKWLGSLSLTAQSRLLTERSSVAVLDVLHYQTKVVESSPAAIKDHYAYVDNMGVCWPFFGRNDEVATASQDEAKEAFEGRGLLLHEMEVTRGGADTLGVAVSTRGLCIAPIGKRPRNLRWSLGGFLALSYSTGMCVEMLLGHCKYAALTCWMPLCIFHTAYAFVQSAGEDAVSSGPSVREEFWHFRGLLSVCQSDWARQWSPYVKQTDASEMGYGICSSMWPRSVVAACGRTTARSRFKRLPGASARSHALESAGFKFVGNKRFLCDVLPEHHEALFGEWAERFPGDTSGVAAS